MEKLIELLERGLSPFHVVAQVQSRLEQSGYVQLPAQGTWNLVPGRKYYVSPYRSMLVAFYIPEKWDGNTRVKLAMAHTDFPCFKIKPNPYVERKGYGQLNVEPYGGMIKETWFDRPLGIAGKVVVRGEDAYHPRVKLFHSTGAVALIPSLAPHLNRETDSKKLDMQQEMLPLITMVDTETPFCWESYLADALDTEREEILDYDLFLTNLDTPQRVGMQGEYLSAPRIDNLASVAAITDALEQAHDTEHFLVAGFFDHEEIGSRSKQGADSTLLSRLFQKMARSLGIDDIMIQDMATGGFLLSVDGAHGLHPNYPGKSDITNDLILGKGFAIKSSASQRYLSDSESVAVLESLCREHGILCQRQVNRSGMPGGQTLGPLAVSYLPMAGADVGIPMLAMHSARELIHFSDYQALSRLLHVYFG
ncbi:MAG: M18 family aminopeptidase [Roseburia sp.]